MNSKFIMLAALLSLGGAVSQTGEDELRVLRVALVAPLSGNVNEIGRDLRAAATLSLIKARREFQKLGFDLQLKTYDDKMSPGVARQEARSIIGDRDTLVVVGSFASDVTRTLAETLAGAQLGLVIPSASEDALTEKGLKNVNRLVARNDEVGQAAGQYIQKVLKAKKVLLLHDNTEDGRDVNLNVGQYLKAQKVRVVGQVWTSERNTFSEALALIKRFNPDVIQLGFSSYETGARLIRQMRKAGVKAQVLGTASFSDPKFLTLAGKDAAGVYYASYAAPVLSYPSQKIPTFVKEYGQILIEAPTSYSVLGYDAMQVALEGLRGALKANKGKFPTRAQVQLALRGVQVENTLSGTIAFNSVGDVQQTSVYVMRIGDDLKTKLVSILPVQAPQR